jgi:hypothetical protein
LLALTIICANVSPGKLYPILAVFLAWQFAQHASEADAAGRDAPVGVKRGYAADG